MALVNRTFSQLIDFTRTSAGTFFGSNGLLQTTPASVNLLTYTQEFDNAAWTKSSATIAANSDVAPDGTSTADTMTDDGTSARHSINQNSTITASATYTASVYVKAGTGRYFTLSVSRAAAGSVYYAARYDLQTATVTATGVGGGGGTHTASSITAVGNGWYRCVLTGVLSTFTDAVVMASSAANSTGFGDRGAEVYTGTSSTWFLWGFQFEAASAASTYTRNFGGVYPPRFGYNPVSLQPLGLLIEEQRANLLIYSEQFDNAAWSTTNLTVTANSVAAPTGGTTADTFDDAAASGLHRVFRGSLTYTAAAQTVSVFAKAGTGAWFQLVVFDGTTTFYANYNVSSGAVGNKSASTTSSITSVGNGWYRCVMTVTTASTAAGNFQIGMLDADTASALPSFTGASRTLYMWGVQHEVGAFPTSYIQTVASQVTRTSDNALIQAPNFAPWYNQPQGTVYVEFTPDNTVANTAVRVLTISQAAAASRVVDIYPNVGNWTTFNGTTNLAAGAATVTSSPQKFAAAFASGSYAACLNGGTVATASTAAVNSPTQMTIGFFPTPSNYLNGHMRAIRFYPARLTDAQLQALTA